MIYLEILTRFLSFSSLYHTCGYVRHASGIYIAYANNIQSNIQLELGLKMDSICCSACASHMLRRYYTYAGHMSYILLLLFMSGICYECGHVKKLSVGRKRFLGVFYWFYPR